MPARQDPTGASFGTPVLLGSLLYLPFVPHSVTLYCEPRPVSYVSWPLASALLNGTGYKDIRPL